MGLGTELKICASMFLIAGAVVIFFYLIKRTRLVILAGMVSVLLLLRVLGLTAALSYAKTVKGQTGAAYGFISEDVNDGIERVIPVFRYYEKGAGGRAGGF